MLFYLVIFLIAHRLLPLVGGVLARYFKGEVSKPAVFCSPMPMLHVGWNVDDCARENLLHRLAFFLVPATSGYAYQHLSATLCGVVRVPVVAAARLKGYVEERCLTVGYLRQITVALEILGVSGVRLADREDHLALECSLCVFAFHVFAPHLLSQIECCPGFWPTGVEGDVGDDLCRFRASNSIILCRLQVIFQRTVGDSLADERSDCYQTAVCTIFCCAMMLSEIVVNMMNVPITFFILPCIYAVLRYSLGVLPVCALKKRTKCCGYSKPRRWLTCVMLRVSSSSSWRENESSRSLIILLAVLPVSVLTNSPKYLVE